MATNKSVGFLGIDLGSAEIKLVEFHLENKRPKLFTYGSVAAPFSINNDLSDKEVDELAKRLKLLVEKSRCQSRHVCAALPNFSVFNAVVSFPPMKKGDLERAVQWEAKKLMNLPVEEIRLEWQVLENIKKGKEAQTKSPFVNVLLLAAPVKTVERYGEVFEKAGLDLVGIETEAFALERALIGNDPSAILIVDVGGETCDMIVVSSGIPLVNRSIQVGGAGFTSELARRLGISNEEAEQVKRDLAALSPEKQSAIIREFDGFFGQFVNEIRFSMDLYEKQKLSYARMDAVEKIILTGGSSLLPAFSQYLDNALGVKTFLGDPWARVIYPNELKTLLQEVGPRFSVAIGLAMKNIR